MSQGRGFLDEGPYPDRAKALLNAPVATINKKVGEMARARLQMLVDYLMQPAPIDEWKAEIGDAEDRPRLRHLIAFWAASNGYKVKDVYPETLQALRGRDVREVALEYIEAVNSRGAHANPESDGNAPT
jgi:hypothetical protein